MTNEEINTCKYSLSAFPILMSFRYVVVEIKVTDMYLFMSALTYFAKHLE